MKTNELTPLAPGDVAVRFQIEWRGSPARPVATRMQAVWVVSVVGERVVWTNGLPARAGRRDEYRHVSHRRELIALSALEAVTVEFFEALVAEITPATSAGNGAAGSRSVENDAVSSSEAGVTRPGVATIEPSQEHPWYQRDLDEPLSPADAPSPSLAAPAETAAA